MAVSAGLLKFKKIYIYKGTYSTALDNLILINQLIYTIIHNQFAVGTMKKESGILI